MTHEAFNAATARRVPQAAQGRVNPGRAISSAMGQVEPADLAKQSAIGRLAWAFRAAAPGIIPRHRDAHDIAQDANRERLTLILDDAEFHFSGSEKMRSVFFKISRSMRRRSFSRRRRAFSAARSTPAGGIAACVLESAAAISLGRHRSCCAKPAAAQRESRVPRQSGSTAGRCVPKAPKPLLEFIRISTVHHTHKTVSEEGHNRVIPHARTGRRGFREPQLCTHYSAKQVR